MLYSTVRPECKCGFVYLFSKSVAFLQLWSVCSSMYVRHRKLVSSIFVCYNYPIDFKLWMMSPVTIRYGLESVATL